MHRLALAALLLAACGIDAVPPHDGTGMLSVTAADVHVTSDPPAIDCGNGGSECISAFPALSVVTLHVTELPSTCNASVFVVDDFGLPRCKTFTAQCTFGIDAGLVHEVAVSCIHYPP